MQQPTFDIERAARFLIMRFGEDSACVAWHRAEFCRCNGDDRAETDWRRVLRRVVELYFRHQRGTLH